MINVNDIMSVMNNIEYGFKDYNGFNIMNDSKKLDRFFEFYYLLSPLELLEKKCGVCWDQVELERYLFNKNNISCSTYFIYLDDKKELPSHTFLTYENAGKYYWFEHSWCDYRGFHEYDSINDLLLDVKDKFILSLGSNYNEKYELYLYKYLKPNEHITCDEFYEYIKTQELIEI